MNRPSIIFLHANTKRIRYRTASHHWLAAEIGFRSFAVNWRSVRVADGKTWIRGGYEALSSRRKRPIRRWEAIDPTVIVHRIPMRGQAERLMTRLAEVHPRAILSYHPCWKAISQKWVAEVCLRAAADVPRPPTYLVKTGAINTVLSRVGETSPLIFKPSTGSMCKGIQLSTPETFSRVAGAVGRSSRQYVVQRLVQNPVLYQGRKFDFRVFVVVTSMRPLRLHLCREGVVRLAARRFDPRRQRDGLRELTGCSYRKRRRVPIHNTTTSRLLAHLRARGMQVGDFWERLDNLVRAVFVRLSRHPALDRVPDIERRFYLGGLDVMMAGRGDSYELLFLETNYYPQLNSWGARVDRGLRTAHRQWLAEIHQDVVDRTSLP